MGSMFRRIASIYGNFRLRRLLANEFESIELRRLFQERHRIEIGMYSYGCFDQNRIAPGTRIGRYCSFAGDVRVFNGNHGISFLTTHPYLYNPWLGMVKEETIQRTECVIEDDVWVGYGALILPSVRCIGRGAIIAAGAVVTKDVPKYAIVAGNPAVLKRYRFSPDVIHEIEMSNWWLLDKAGLKKLMIENKAFVYAPASRQLGDTRG